MLKGVIQYAYALESYRLPGAPKWLETEKQDIVVKAPGQSSNDQLRLMLRSLLEERFALRFHREEKEVAVYALVLAKNGPKFRVEHRDKREGDGRFGGAGRGRIGGFGVALHT